MRPPRLCSKRLWVEVVGARNLESRHALDAYCVLQVVSADSAASAPHRRRSHRQSRSPSVHSSDSSASWPHALELEVDADTDATVAVQLFNEKNFFFDMFPASSDSVSSRHQSVNSSSSCSDSDSEDEGDTDAPVAIDATLALETDSEDDDDDERACSDCDHRAQKVHCSVQIGRCFTDEDEEPLRTPKTRIITPPAVVTHQAEESDDGVSTDESLGCLELSASRFCNSPRIATDTWYRLCGTRSGEVRVRTLCLDATTSRSHQRLSGEAVEPDATAPPDVSAAMRETLFQTHLYDSTSMRDHYGFAIPESVRAEWTHLRSYEACREERRVSDWELAVGAEFCSLHQSTATRTRSAVQQLARAGVPRSWRERVYMNVSGTLPIAGFMTDWLTG